MTVGSVMPLEMSVLANSLEKMMLIWGKKILMLGKIEGRRRRIRWLDGISNTTACI